VIDALHRADRELEVMALPRRAPGPIWEAEGDGSVEPWHRHKPAVPASLTSQLGFDFDKA
jgi:hypothetical protein